MQNPNRLSRLLEWLWGWLRELPRPVKWGVIVVLVLTIIKGTLPPSLFHSFNCQLQNLPRDYRSSNGYFMDGQVIVVGSRNDVDEVIWTPASGAPEPGQVLLKLIEGCDLSYLDSRKDPGSNAVRGKRGLVMRLYEIPDGAAVGDVVANINAVADNKNVALSVDPNYLTRLADSTSDPCALPSEGGGNGGRPFGGSGPLDPEGYDAALMKAAFETQWAFRNINLLPTSPFTGAGVQVAVLDTASDRISFPFIKRVGEASPSPLWLPNWDVGGVTMASSHGRFVATLIHGLAPNARIQLVRVLNEDGCGELWVLNKGLEDYKSRMSAWPEDLNKTVINMSLGIRLPNSQEDEDSGTEQDAPGEPENDSAAETEPGDTTPEANGDEYEGVETLRSLIDIADELGAIIVASAGNDSTLIRDASNNIVKYTADMQFPAALSNVLGVAATNPEGKPACYSSRGDVAAPGGDGGPAEKPQPDGTLDLCVPRASTWNKPPGPSGGPPCNDAATCPYIVIGMGVTRYGDRYMGWSGTSFAGPHVASMAALGLEKMEKKLVLCLIQNGPSATTDPILGTGLIDLNDLSDSALISKCNIP